MIDYKINKNQPLGFCLSLITAAMWGILPIALKELLAGMDAATIVWYRFLLAALFVLGWLYFRGQLPNPAGVSKLMRGIIIIAAAGLCANYVLFSYSLNYVNAETSEAVIQLTTLFLILGGVVFYKEQFTTIQKVGTLLILTGLILFFHDRFTDFKNLGNRQTIGVSIVFFSAIAWTIYALLQKKLLRKFKSFQLLFMMYFFSAAVLLPFVSPSLLFQLTGFQIFLLSFCCINTLVAYGCFTEALNCWEASKVSAVLALAPLFTIVGLQVIVSFNPEYAYSDRLTVLSIIGAMLLVLGSMLTALMPILSIHFKSRD
jgi:drug/metabolite transporter (DMT)-like permease